jgi:hypothetical protein
MSMEDVLEGKTCLAEKMAGFEVEATEMGEKLQACTGTPRLFIEKVTLLSVHISRDFCTPHSNPKKIQAIQKPPNDGVAV